MNRKKTTKYEIGQSSQFVDLPMYYITKINGYITQEYIITQDLLDQENVPSKKFLKYLKDELSKSDKFYESCDEIFLSNGPVTSKVKTDLNINEKRSIKNIVSIFIGNEVINIDRDKSIKEN